MSRYLIIGNGLVGRLTAWRLLVAGHEVAILSKDDWQGRDSAGYVAASMISPATEAISSEKLVKVIGSRSYELWPQWLNDLPEPVFYQNEGTLVIAHHADSADMERFCYHASHVLDESDFQRLNHEQLIAREPELAEKFQQAMWFEHESCLDNRHLYQQLSDLLSEHCLWQQCDEIEHLDEAEIERLCLKHFAYHADSFDAVIDCRGNGAHADISQLRSVRGEVIRVHAPEVNFKHAVRLIHPRYPFYLAPRPNNEYVLGATVIESDDRSPVSVRSGLELLSALYSLHSGFGEARILEMAVHCRPGLPNNLPTIEKTSWGYRLNGFYRHGYLFGPAVVNDLLKLLSGDPNAVMFGELYVT